MTLTVGRRVQVSRLLGIASLVSPDQSQVNILDRSSLPRCAMSHQDTAILPTGPVTSEVELDPGWMRWLDGIISTQMDMV